MRKERCWRIQQKRLNFVVIALKTNACGIVKYAILEEVTIAIAAVQFKRDHTITFYSYLQKIISNLDLQLSLL